MARKRASAKNNSANNVSVKAKVSTTAVAEVDEAQELDNDQVTEQTDPDNRRSPRTVTDLKTIVQFHIGPDETWKEVTRVLTVSRSGASFTMSHHCDVGRLVTLVMPLAPEFRAYDFTAELYPVIGLVQYCHPTTADGGQQTFSVGVAFVGKTFPEGHKENPTQNYHISGTTPTGMWQIKPSGATFKVRAAPRFWVPLEVTITQIKRDRASSGDDYKEQSVTTNVSMSGASVPCSLDLEIGDRLKFASKEHDFYTIAVVRNRQVKQGKKPVLHIEFVDNRFPVEKIAVPQVTAVTA